MKKCMISQPMAGFTNSEIWATRNRAIKRLEELGFDTVPTFFDDQWHESSTNGDGVGNLGIWFLGKSIQEMAKCNAIYMCSGWENARGCVVEHIIAQKYGLEIIYEDEPAAATTED